MRKSKKSLLKGRRVVSKSPRRKKETFLGRKVSKARGSKKHNTSDSVLKMGHQVVKSLESILPKSLQPARRSSKRKISTGLKNRKSMRTPHASISGRRPAKAAIRHSRSIRGRMGRMAKKAA